MRGTHPAVALHQRDAVEPAHADARVRAPAQLAQLGADRVRARRFVHGRRRAPRPGVANWLDTGGHRFGTIFWRYLLPETDPTIADVRGRAGRQPALTRRSVEWQARGDGRAELPARVEIGRRRFADHRHRRLRQRHCSPVVTISTARIAPVVSLLPCTYTPNGRADGRFQARVVDLVEEVLQRARHVAEVGGRAEQVAVGGEHVVGGRLQRGDASRRRPLRSAGRWRRPAPRRTSRAPRATWCGGRAAASPSDAQTTPVSRYARSQ